LELLEEFVGFSELLIVWFICLMCLLGKVGVFFLLYDVEIVGNEMLIELEVLVLDVDGVPYLGRV
jgi:hypothetical protein